MSLRAIQKRDRNKLSSAQQKQQQLFINKGRGSSFVGTPLGGSGSSLLVSSTGSIGASSNNSNNNNHHHHHHHHHQQPGKNEKWRNSNSSSLSASLSSASTGLTHAKRSVSYPSLQKRTSRGSPSSSLRFSKSESDLQDSGGQQSPGGTTTSPNHHHHQRQLDSSANNLLYLGAKSEVCLKTLAVKSTHQPPAPFQNRSGGGTRGGNRMYESNNNNNGAAARRPSDFGGALDKLGGTGGNNAVRIPIIGYEVMEERARFTIFKLRIENSISHTCWLVLRRYTDFVRLNNRLRATFPHCQLVLPRKKWFGDNFSSGFIDNRIQGLQTFINTIMGDDAMRTSPPVREFFCLDEPPAYSESMEESRIIFEAQEETIAHLKQQLQTKDELVAALQAKLASEMNRNKVLTSVIRNSFENCSKCAKQLDNHLKEAAYK